MDFEFTPGKFEKLRVVKGFHFGPLAMDMRLNQVIEFDGTALKIGDKIESKPPIPMAILSACRAGWAVLEVEGKAVVSNEPAYKAATVQVHAAQTTGNDRGATVYLDSVTEDDRVVGTVKASSVQRETAEKKSNASFNVATDAPVAVVSAVDSQPLEVTYPGVGNTPKKFLTTQDDSSGQGGSMIKTATHQKINMGGDTSQASTGVEVGKIAISTPQKTMVTEDTVTEDETDLLSDETIPVAKVQKVAQASSEGVTVARVTPAVKRMVVTDSGTAAVETARLRDDPPPKAQFVTVKAEEAVATGDVSEVRSGDTLEALLPDAASSGVPAAGVAGEGFSWDNKTGYWGNRVKEAVAKYGDNPSIIAQIIKIEGPTIGKHIQKAMAERK